MTTREFIEKHEGRRNKPYLDNAKPPKETIGVGWNMDAKPLPEDIQEYLNANGEITEEMIDRLLDISVEVAESCCQDLFPDFDNFSENRKMALTDFTFQLGEKTEKHFVHTLAAINTGRWEDAAEGMRNSRWFNEVPNRAKEVIELIEEG